MKKNQNTGPTYTENESTVLYGYSDSDWAGDTERRKSTSGYVFMFGGAAISWCSKKQATVALSSAEAEYMAVCAATQEAIYLRALLKDLGHEQTTPTTIFQDNQGSIAMSKNTVNSRRTKHIDIRYHYTRDMVESGQIELEYIPTTEMVADCFTKPVTKLILNNCKDKIFGESEFQLRESVKACKVNAGNLIPTSSYH